MDIVIIALSLVAGLMGLGLLAMLVFGVRSLVYGKLNPLTMAIICMPVVLLLVLGFVMGDWSRAGLLTIAIMLVLALVSLLLTGLKGLFT